MSATYSIFIPVAKGLEYLLEEELLDLGVTPNKVNNTGAFCEVDLKALYTLLLSLRLASRVLVKLYEVELNEQDSIYQSAKNFNWQKHVSSANSLKIEFRGTNKTIRNSMYGGQLLKDGLCDYFRAREGMRPNIDKLDPEVVLFGYLKHRQLSVYLDPLGYPLHQRGYREEKGKAPIKETLAAALLKRSKFDKKVSETYGLFDPCCGSGTLVIEAAMMALNLAPGLLKTKNNLKHWKAHDLTLYDNIRNTLRAQFQKAKEQSLAPLIGHDKSSYAIKQAKLNALNAGVSEYVKFKQQQVEDFSLTSQAKTGLMISNPPYGERLDETLALIPLYEAIGGVYKKLAEGFDCAIISNEPLLVKATKLRAYKKYSFYNGALACFLYLLKPFEHEKSEGNDSTVKTPLFNRLKKNDKNLKRWREANTITCYRIYDADLPEYAAAIDIYNDCAHIQEYRAPSEIPESKAEARLIDILKTVPKALELPAEQMVLKQRRQQKGKNQYQKHSGENERMVVREGSIQCYVNLHDYLDTGLFLDHRLLRCSFETLKAKTFLNLYCYTGVASLHAAKSGSVTTNVDLSNTYLNWAKDNFRLNRFTIDKHKFVNQDCFAFLKECKETFDVIFLDPPSFSNSKKVEGTLDICRDHPHLIKLAMSRLSENGVLYFSTNAKKFKLDEALKEDYHVIDITLKTIDKDFNPKKPPHLCFKLIKA